MSAPRLTALAAFVLMAAFAGSSPASSADPAPASSAPASPASSSTAPAGADAFLDLFAEGVVWRSTGCQATKDCGDGNQIQCTGSTTCAVVSNGVRCDGVTTTCPNYCVARVDCNCPCGATVSISCSSNVGNCVVYDVAVSCDGQLEGCFYPCYQAC